MFDLCPLVLQSQLVQKEVVDQLQERLTAAEEALAVKQDRIDHMKQEIFQKEKDLETISVFQAQVSGKRKCFDIGVKILLFFFFNLILTMNSS